MARDPDGNEQISISGVAVFGTARSVSGNIIATIRSETNRTGMETLFRPKCTTNMLEI